jgi:hypothetical protein
LYEEVVLRFPLPLWERGKVRGKGVAMSFLIQMKNAAEKYRKGDRSCRRYSLTKPSPPKNRCVRRAAFLSETGAIQ